VRWIEGDAGRIGDRVESEIHYRFAPGGEKLVSTNELRFRTRDELTRSLTDAGFSIEHVLGDWDGQPVEAESPELIFVASRLEPEDGRGTSGSHLAAQRPVVWGLGP
jgi:hypothetical protein